jgi:purine-binding chemotaxis protein CheW
MQVATDVCSQTEIPYATFFVNDVLLGIQVRRVREVNRQLDWTSVPHAPPFVRGVMSLRGEVLTVVDLSLLLGMEATDGKSDGRNVIIQIDDELVGLMVDRVADIHDISPESIEPAPGNFKALDAKIIRGVYQTETEIVVMLNADELLSEN